MKTKIQWQKNNRNYVLIRKDYYISYNPGVNSDSESGMWHDLGFILGGLSNENNKETALVDKKGGKPGKMLILLGDFRKQYEKCKTYSECLKFYESKKAKYQSTWSEDREL